MYGYETPPTFRTAAFLAAQDVNVLRRNAVVLDMLSLRIEAASDSLGAYSDPSYNVHDPADILLWRGALQWRTGLTTMVISGTAASFGSTTLLITIDGVLKDTVTLGATWVSSFSIAAGYTNGQVLDIRVTTSGNVSGTSEFTVYHVYAYPVTVTNAWPGALPTFAGTYSAANLAKLSQACDYLYERIATCPMVPHLAHVWRNGTHKAQNFTLWNGTVERGQSGDIIRIGGNATIRTTTGSFVADIKSPTGVTDTHTVFSWTAAGTYTFNVTYSFPSGTAVGDRARVVLSDVVTAPIAQPWPPNNLYNILVIRGEPTAAAQTPPAESAANVSITATTLNSRLNAIGTMLSTIKTRVDASPSFGRIRAMRYKFATDDHQAAKMARTYPQTFIRRGSRLIVRGKNVILGFGPITFEHDDEGATDYAKFKWGAEQTLISGEAIQTQTVYLDSIAGLFPGTTYFIFGEPVFASEYL